MRHFALIGYALTHSYSKRLFDERHFADADYRLCALPSTDGLREWVQREGIDGFNVTVPYKQAIMPLLDAVSPEAARIGAVNCVTVDHGHLTGHNTDAPAFRSTVQDFLHPATLSPRAVFVLGTGGAARAVGYALHQLGLDCTFVSRTPGRHNSDNGLRNVIDYCPLTDSPWPERTLIVNATPVGMYPVADASPLNPFPSRIPSSTFVYDLVYNPSPTLLMQQASAKGAKVADGLAMLRRQAELSWELFGLQSAN
mgnify:CR=1 FL=1